MIMRVKTLKSEPSASVYRSAYGSGYARAARGVVSGGPLMGN